MNRKLLSRASMVALLGACVLGLAQAQTQSPPYDPAIETRTTIADGFTIATVGDIIFPLPLSKSPDAGLQDALKPLKAATVAFGNFEMSVVDMETFKGGVSGGFLGEPAMVEDLKAMGFDAVQRATNHLYDYGVEGMLETNEWLEKAGIVYAGSGRSYGSAHAPRYLMTDHGRVAFVASSTSMSPTYTSLPTIVRAEPPMGESPGRPGVAQIRTTQVYVVPHSFQSALEMLKKAIPTGGALYAPTNDTPEQFSVMDQEFRYGDVSRVTLHYDVNQGDVKEVLKSVREGKMKSDFLVFGIHNHENRYPDKPDTDPIPGDFAQDLAHKIIDAGADVYSGTGVHVLRGIEIYHGRPIFYGLGEFFRQMDINRPSGFMPMRGDVNSDPGKYQSVVAVSRFEHGSLAEVRLYPVDLGSDMRVALRGIPRTASPAVAQEILHRLQTLSEPYGTRIAIVGNVGVITVQGAAPAKRK